jgi:hypothetical protein
MTHQTRLIVAGFLLVLLFQPAFGQGLVYYVSPSGNDSDTGLSPTAAWQTLNAAGARLSLLQSPWSLLLARNHSWRNDFLSLNLSQASGDIVIGDYGSPLLPQPLIQGVRGLNGGSACLTLTSVPSTVRLQIRQLHVAGCPIGLAISADNGQLATDTVIERCVFLDLRTPALQYSPPNPRWAAAIFLAGGSFRNLTVRNNLACRIDTFFASNGYVSAFNLDSNTVQQCGGNCYSFGSGVDLVMRNSVMLRDVSDRLFMYGTTDVIVGGISGYNALIDNDFNQRGEYEGGPDGCAFDFETSANGFVVQGNTFARSWGSGIMIFGHASTSHNITLDSNVFAYDGCVQVRADRGGIAVMCPNGQIPQGTLSNNIFYTCPEVPAMYVNPSVPGCASNLTLINNTVNGSTAMVPMPQVSFNPPSPDCTDLAGRYNVVGIVPGFPNAVIRYTLDGSRPSAASAVLPQPGGIDIQWPGPVVVINMRAFVPGMVPSVTNGAVVEANYVLCREAPIPNPGPSGLAVQYLRGNLDDVGISSPNGSVAVIGWAVDPLLPAAGWGPVTLQCLVDFLPVHAAVASVYRPDLVKAGVAPNAEHGFAFELPPSAAAALLAPGRHLLQVFAVGTPNAAVPTMLPERGHQWVCGGQLC